MNKQMAPPCTDTAMSRSFSPEVHAFYGDGKTVIRKLEEFNASVADRRVYLFTLETANNAEVSLFEKHDPEADSCDVFSWTGDSLGNLPSLVGSSILSNRGVACVGEQTKALVTKYLSPIHREQGIPSPATPRAAFGHTLNRYKDEYVRANCYMLC
jgi:hypothetical protein